MTLCSRVCLTYGAFDDCSCRNLTERTFGLSGLIMIIFAVSAVTLHPDWSGLAQGLVPLHPPPDTQHRLLYAYFALGIFSAMLMEYEVHFYSLGGLEEEWKPKYLGENFMVASLGSIFGPALTVALMALGALLFLPHQIVPQMLSVGIDRCGAVERGAGTMQMPVAKISHKIPCDQL